MHDDQLRKSLRRTQAIAIMALAAAVAPWLLGAADPPETKPSDQ